MNKYEPLRTHLAARYPEEITMTFDEIAALVGGLPPTADKWPAYWANEDAPQTHPQKKAWNAAGYRPKFRDMNQRYVVFEPRS